MFKVKARYASFVDQQPTIAQRWRVKRSYSLPTVTVEVTGGGRRSATKALMILTCSVSSAVDGGAVTQVL